jgi:hypothetical protein
LRKQITFTHAGTNKGVAWVSFQPDGSISCGLRDRTYIAPEMRARVNIWNLYNRVGIKYVIPNHPATLEPVVNPHFTFHPALKFHLKSDKDRAFKDEAIFEGIAEVRLVLQQQKEMPWIRATSQPLSGLPEAGPARSDGIANDDLVYGVPLIVADASASVEIDFIRPANVRENREHSPWEFKWGEVGLRIKADFVAPQIATLSWFHFY